MSLTCSQVEIYGFVYKGLVTVLMLVPVLNAPEEVHDTHSTCLDGVLFTDRCLVF
jgi:hypothetical protein